MSIEHQDEDANIIVAVTRVVREADAEFERVGGSSRHWVRDCFLPLLARAGLYVLQRSREADTKVWYDEAQHLAVKAERDRAEDERKRLTAEVEEMKAHGDRVLSLYMKSAQRQTELRKALEGLFRVTVTINSHNQEQVYAARDALTEDS